MRSKLLLQVIIMLLVRTSILFAQPAFQWQQNLGGTGNDSAYSIKQTTDGGYIVVGQSNSNNVNVSGNHGGTDYWVAKLNAAGNIVWQKSFGGSGTDIAKAVQQTSDGGYIIAGISNSENGDVTDHGHSFNNTGVPDYIGDAVYEPWLVKLNSTGAVLWKRSLHSMYVEPGTGNTFYFQNYVNTIIQTTDGGYVVGGNIWDYPNTGPGYHTDDHAMLAKLTSDGSVTWLKRMEQTGYVFSVVQSGSNYTCTGFSTNIYNEGGWDMFVHSFNDAGVEAWSLYNLGGADNDEAYDIQKTFDGGYILVGRSKSASIWNGSTTYVTTGNHGGYDVCLIKITGSGVISWLKCFGGSLEDEARSVIQSADGNYIFAGSSYSNDGQVTGHTAGTQADYWVAKINSASNFIWGRSYGGSATDDAVSIARTNDGGFIVAGASASTNAGFVNKGVADYWLLKFQECGFIYFPTVAHTQTFCSGATVASLAATPAAGGTIKWFTVSVGGVALPSTTVLTARQYFVSQTFGTCEGYRDSMIVVLNPTPVVPNAVNQSFCSGGATVANLVATGSAGAPIKWYNVATGGTALVSTTPLINGNYYVTQTSNRGCESARRMISVAAGTSGPPAAANQGFCNSSTHTVAELVATGVTGALIKWYNVATGGAALFSTAPIATGNYYVSQTTGTCESSRRTVLVTINATPVMPNAPAIQSFCILASPKVSNLVATGAAGAVIKWYNVASGGTALAPTTALTNGNYYVTQTSNRGCESSRRTVAVSVTIFCKMSAKPSPDDAKDAIAVKRAGLYPNPASGLVTINIKAGNNNDNAVIQVVDIYGKILRQYNATNNNGYVQKTIDISQLPNALYVVKYTIGKENGEIKLQVIK